MNLKALLERPAVDVESATHPLPLAASLNFDVCVVGGGPAGVSAACAAARMNKSVLLVERNGFLGGALTAVTLGSICGLYRNDGDTYVQLVGGFADRLMQCLNSLGSYYEPLRWLQAVTLPYDSFAMRAALDALLVESGARPMLHASLLDVEVQAGRLNGVIIQTSAGALRVRAEAYVDCTGDAELVARAGGGFEVDFENLQYPTAMFRLGGVDHAAAKALSRPELHRILEQAVDTGFALPRTAGGIFLDHEDHAHLNITKVSTSTGAPPNPLDWSELTEAEIEGRRQILQYAKAFRKMVPGYSNSYVLDCGSSIGVRESRRVEGRYQLTAEDVLASKKFDDGIALCSWPMEEHGRGRSTKWIWLDEGKHFEIPYRCLLPQGLSNVLAAGRCISTTHEAQASIRVTAQCFATGEAAGTAAALALQDDVAPAEISIQRLKDELHLSGSLPHL